MDSIELWQPAKTSFDPNQPLTTASKEHCIQAIKDILADEFFAPSHESLGYFAGRLTLGTTTSQSLDRFAPIVKEAFRQFIDDRVDERLQPVKNGEAEHVMTAIYNKSNKIGTDVGRVAAVTDEEFEKFFVVDIT